MTRLPNGSTPDLPKSTDTWRMLPHHVGDSEGHMALTDRLVRSAANHGASLWWHSTNGSTLLLGPAMHAAARNAGMGVPTVRRPTGGGAVLVGPGVLGLDIALPVNHPLLTGDIVRDYEWLGNTWSHTLRRLDIEAECIGLAESRERTQSHKAYVDAGLACFGLVAPFEVTAGRRKLVGLSQVRRAGGVLFSSAVYIDADPCMVAGAMPLPTARRRRLARHLENYAASLTRVAPRPLSAVDVMDTFRSSLTRLHSVHLRAGAWPAA